jgi:glycosyltransferase involved in cell wall biosynthesis
VRDDEDSHGRVPSLPALVRRNRWQDVALPDEPLPTSLSVSVVIPAYACQATLPYTLAALAHQTYPDDLLEVVVADDGNEPALTLPEERPGRTRVVRVEPPSWGRAAACHTGALAADGDVVFFLDSDMVPFHDHVESQLRWHHLLSDAVTMGHKLFVPSWQHVTLAQTVTAAREHRLRELFDESASEAHWVEEVYATTDRLNLAGTAAFRVFVGATGAMRKDLYLAAGGMDTSLRLGEDTELAYRLAQAGAVFLPDHDSSSWHLGPPTVLTQGRESRRWNHPHLANRMGYPRGLRRATGRVWPIPLVRAVVPVGPQGYEVTRGCVDRLLASDEEDLHVDLVGPWGDLTTARRSVLTDPMADLHLLREWYLAEPRVRLLEAPEPDSFPSPFRLELSPSVGVGRGSVRKLLRAATRHELGVVRVLVPGHAPEDAPRLTRTAAVRRAERHLGRSDDTALGEVWGLRWLDGTTVKIVDLAAAANPLDGGRWTRDTSRLHRRLRRQNRRLKSLRRKLREARRPRTDRLLGRIRRAV